MGRWLGRRYLSAVALRERGRIQRALLPERVEPGRVIGALVRRQRGLVLTLVLFIGVGIGVDVLAHEFAASVENTFGIRHWLTHNISLPSEDTLRVLLAATAGATGTILGIVLSITLIVFQTTAERYGSARIVSFLLRERVGSAVLRLLALSFAYSLSVLVLMEVVTKARPPYFSAAVALLMSIAGVLALITYRTHALFGYLPASITDALTGEMIQMIARAGRRHAGRTVEHHTGRFVEEDIRTQGDLLRRLIMIDRDVVGVAAVVASLSGLLEHYSVAKRFLRKEGEWWAKESVRADSPLTRMTEQLATRGLMDPTTQQPDRHWLEKRLLALVDEVIASNMLQEADVCDSTVELLMRNAQIAFRAQEFDTCWELLAVLKRLADHDLALTDEHLAERLAQVTWMLFHLLDAGIGFSADRVVASQPWKHPADHLGLPWVEREAAETLGTQVRREVAIAGSVVTPHDAMVREVERSFAPAEKKIRDRLVDESYDWLYGQLRRAVQAKAKTAGTIAKQALRALLKAAHDQLPLRIACDLPELLGEAFYGEQDAILRNDVREDCALLARNLAEAGHWEECWRVLYAAALINTLARGFEQDDAKRSELILDLLMSLAQIYGWGELTGESEHLRHLMVYLEHPWHGLDGLATLVGDESFWTAWSFSMAVGVKYQRWFQTLLLAASQLTPAYAFVGPQQIPVERGKAHESPLFRKWSIASNYDDILKEMIESAVARRLNARRQLLETLRAVARTREGQP